MKETSPSLSAGIVIWSFPESRLTLFSSAVLTLGGVRTRGAGKVCCATAGQETTAARIGAATTEMDQPSRQRFLRGLLSLAAHALSKPVFDLTGVARSLSRARKFHWALITSCSPSSGQVVGIIERSCAAIVIR